MKKIIVRIVIVVALAGLIATAVYTATNWDSISQAIMRLHGN